MAPEPTGRVVGRRVVGRRVVDRRVGAVLVGCALLYAVFIWRPSFVFRGQRWFTLFDDAMISMTYARNLADGHGLVWNANGPAVEGYTNPLWTLVMTAVHLVGLPENVAPLAVSIVAALLVLGCVVMAAAIARQLRPESDVAPVLAAVLTGLYYPLVYWALRGMEVGLVTFLVLAAVLLAMRLRERMSGRDLVLLCLVMAAGLLTRDDFVVPAAVVGGWLLVVLRSRVRWTVAAALVGTGIAVMGAQLAFRLAYYGEPLPNTYYLKVAGQPIGPRLWRGLLTLTAVVLADAVVLIGVVVAGIRGSRRARPTRRVAPEAWLLLALAAALAAYSVSVGGDAWEWARLANRYVTPAAVALLVLAATLVEPLAARIRSSRRGAFVLVALVAVALAFGLVDSFVGVLLHPWLGEHLGVTPTGSDIAAVTAVGLVTVLVASWVVLARGRGRHLRVRSDVVMALIAGSLLLTATGNAWMSWARDGGFYAAKNQGATAYGSALRDLTEPGATIAVIWAGAPIYYAHRDGVDLLGKMDPVIAHGPHHEGVPMYPGHDKFDFAHSIEGLRPDVIAQYAWFTTADVDRFVASGYVPMRLKQGTGVEPELAVLDVPRALLFVRGDSARVHRDALEPMSVEEAKARTVERVQLSVS